MTIRAGFLAGGMRRAEAFSVEPHADLLLLASDNDFTPLNVRGSYCVFPKPIGASAFTACNFDYNRNVRKLIVDNGTNITMIDFDRWCFIKSVLATPANLKQIKFSNSGKFFAIASQSSGLRIYESISMDEVRVVLTDKTPQSVCWSQNDRFLGVALYESPYVRCYNVDTWIAMSDPLTLPSGIGKRIGFSRGGDQMAIAHYGSPYITIYDMPSFVKLANPSSLPYGDLMFIGFSPMGNRCVYIGESFACGNDCYWTNPWDSKASHPNYSHNVRMAFDRRGLTACGDSAYAKVFSEWTDTEVKHYESGYISAGQVQFTEHPFGV